MENYFFKDKIRRFYLFFLFSFFATNLFAQQLEIKGLVVDNKNEPLIGASIVVKNTTNGTISDIDGAFTLKTVANATLVVSYLGYSDKEVNVKDQKNIKIVLSEDANLLDEVAVIGYGTIRKKDLTGSLNQVKASQLENMAPSSVTDFLRGNAPGLSVGYSGGAKPSSSLQIRGKNTIAKEGSNPLIVLDGVIYPGDLSDINPNDIEQIDVLKDASSTAIYGAQSAGGVIIITTKIGKTEKPTINADVTFGVANIQKRQRVYGPEGFMKWRTDVQKSINVNHKPYQFDDPRNLPSDLSVDEWLAYDGSKGDPVEAWLNRLSFKPVEASNYLAGRTVDWEDKVFQTAFRQDYNISISGKNDRINYYWSLGYSDYDGLSKSSNFNIVRTRLNFDAKITNFLKVGMNSQFSVRDDGKNTGITDWEQYQKLTPYGTEYDEDGKYKLNPTDDRESKNPFIDSYYTDRRLNTNNLNSSLYALVTLPFNITYQLNYSPRFEWVDDFLHKSAEHPSWGSVGGSAYRKYRKDFLWQLDNIIKWNYIFKKLHKFDVTLVANAEKFQQWTNQMSNNNFSPSDVLGYHGMGLGSNPLISSGDIQTTGDALMARVFYSFKDRYMLTATFRRDGFSAFGQNNPRADFPSAALAWVFSEESFLKKAEWLNYAKLRFSWGKAGNRSGLKTNLIAVPRMVSDNKYQYINEKGEVITIPYIYIERLGNKDLKWETTESFNLGFDYAVLNNRLRGSIDVYRGKTTDMLLDRYLPDAGGYERIISNLGEVENKGVELSITSLNIKNEKFTWSTTFNYSLNRNKIKSLYGDMVDIFDADGNVIGRKEPDDVINKWFIGHPVDVAWGPRILGVWQENEAEEAGKYGQRPGDFKVKDVDGNYKIEEADNEFLGSITPKYSWSLRNDFTILKNIDVSIFIYSDWGHVGKFDIAKHNSGYQDRYNGFILPYWTPENPTNKWARLNSNNGTGSFNVWRKRSFIRLDNISVGYTFPKKLTQKLNIQRLKVFTNVKNVAVYAPEWKFWDPENVNGPVPRTFSIGLNISL